MPHRWMTSLRSVNPKHGRRSDWRSEVPERIPNSRGSCPSVAGSWPLWSRRSRQSPSMATTLRGTSGQGHLLAHGSRGWRRGQHSISRYDRTHVAGPRAELCITPPPATISNAIMRPRRCSPAGDPNLPGFLANPRLYGRDPGTTRPHRGRTTVIAGSQVHCADILRLLCA